MHPLSTTFKLDVSNNQKIQIRKREGLFKFWYALPSACRYTITISRQTPRDSKEVE